jgi:hypothetical protein
MSVWKRIWNRNGEKQKQRGELEPVEIQARDDGGVDSVMNSAGRGERQGWILGPCCR